MGNAESSFDSGGTASGHKSSHAGDAPARCMTKFEAILQVIKVILGIIGLILLYNLYLILK